MAFARVSILSWYLLGIPVAAATVFWLKWGLVGLWGGMFIGNLCSVCFMARLACSLDWDEEARKARERSLKKAAAS